MTVKSHFCPHCGVNILAEMEAQRQADEQASVGGSMPIRDGFHYCEEGSEAGSNMQAAVTSALLEAEEQRRTESRARMARGQQYRLVGRIDTNIELYLCRGCGSAVIDFEIHDDFHRGLMSIADSASYADALRPI